MTSRPGIKRSGQVSPPTSTSSAQLPPFMHQLTPESLISASCIPLSSGFTVHFAVLSAVHASQSHLDIDLGRRRVFESNVGKQIEDSLLTHSQIAKDRSALWVFCIDKVSSGAGPDDFLARLQSTEFTGLTSTFRPMHLYQLPYT